MHTPLCNVFLARIRPSARMRNRTGKRQAAAQGSAGAFGVGRRKLEPGARPGRTGQGLGSCPWGVVGAEPCRGAGRTRGSMRSAFPEACSVLGQQPCAPSRSLKPGSAVMSTAMNFGAKSFQPRPPDKGSFPLDHFGEGGSRRAGSPRLARVRAGSRGGS